MHGSQLCLPSLSGLNTLPLPVSSAERSRTLCPPADSEGRVLAPHPAQGRGGELGTWGITVIFVFKHPSSLGLWREAERARWDPPRSLEEGGQQRGPRSLSQCSLTTGKMYPQVSSVLRAGRCSLSLPLESSGPELGSRRLPALLGSRWRGLGGFEGLERNSLSESISGGRFTAIARSFLPSQPALCGGKNFAAPKINLTEASVPGGGTGAGVARPARPDPARMENTGPGLSPKEKLEEAAVSPGGLRQLGRDLLGACQGRIPPLQTPCQERDSGEQLPLGRQRRDRLPAFPGAFSFANELPGPGGAAGSGHSLPTPGDYLFPFQSFCSPNSGPEEGHEPKSEYPGYGKRGWSRAG